jgi:hypothetical protein
MNRLDKVSVREGSFGNDSSGVSVGRARVGTVRVQANGQARRTGIVVEARRIIRFTVLAIPDRGDPHQVVVNYLKKNKAHYNISLPLFYSRTLRYIPHVYISFKQNRTIYCYVVLLEEGTVR